MMCCQHWLVTLLLFMTVTYSYGYPNGAPENSKVCRNLHPHHRDNKPQKAPSPFSIIPAKDKIASGIPLQVKITARPGYSFKGFVIQVRPSTGGYIPIGSFRSLSSLSKTLRCFKMNNSGITHNSPVLKEIVSFLWTSPVTYKGSVTFLATVVQNFSTYWTHVTANVSVGMYDVLDVNSNSVIRTDVPSEPDITSTEVDHLNRTIYGECGISKVCFGIPDGCVGTRSCSALATVMERESKYEFEMIGVQYTVLSISENGQLDTATMTECVLVNNADVGLYQSKFYEGQTKDEAFPSYKGLKLISTSYANGMAYCKFVRDEVIVLNGVKYNFRSKKYSILLASGSCPQDIPKKNIDNSDDIKFHTSEQNFLSNTSGFCSFCSHHSKYNWRMRFDWVFLILDIIIGVFCSIFSIS